MYYLKLYKEYIKQMDVLKSHIKLLKNTPSEMWEHENIKWRVSVLYSMYLDMKHTAEYLKRKCEVMKNEN